MNDIIEPSEKVHDRLSVVKHSAAVTISNDVTLMQRKIWNVLLSHAYRALPDQEYFTIPVKDLCAILETNTHNQSHIKSALRALAQTTVEWDVLGRDGDKWGVMSLLAEAVMEEGAITYAYGPTLRKYLYHPESYARIYLSMQNKFSSKYSLALYELCVNYYVRKRGRGMTPFILITDLRRLLGLKDDEYGEFKKLKFRVLQPAVREINEKSDLHVEMEFRREQRAISGLYFIITPRGEHGALALAGRVSARQLELPIELVESLVDIGVVENLARQLVSEFGETAVALQLEHLQYVVSEGKTPKNPAAWVQQAIRNSYQPPPGFVSTAAKASAEKVRASKTAQRLKKKQEEELEVRTQRELQARARELIKKMNRAELEERRAAAGAHLAPGLLRTPQMLEILVEQQVIEELQTSA